MSNQQNRRDFIVKPLQVAAATGLLGTVGSALAAETSAAVIKPVYRSLGRTGISLPIVNMGVMNADVPGLIRRAYEIGMRHFDTAAGYQSGRNEEMVGRMIKEMGVRDRVIISTKAHLKPQELTFSPKAASMFRTIFEGSLKRLQMEQVDILYNHIIDSVEMARATGPIEALTALKKEGKTRFIGLSTHRGGLIIDEAIKLGVYDVVLVTINYTLANDRALLESIDRAAKAGMGVIAMKTQAGGLAKPDRKMPKNLPPESQTALLKWVLRHPSITTAIPGFTTYQQLEQDFSVASNLDYTEAEKSFLADKAFVAEAQFCRQCGQCRPDCPNQVDIPTLMRTHMYAVQYRNRELATNTLADMERGTGLDVCRDCTSCQASCRGTVDIASKIAGLKQLALA